MSCALCFLSGQWLKDGVGCSAHVRVTVQNSQLTHVDVSRAYFHVKAQRTVLVKLLAEDCSGKDDGKVGMLMKSMYGTSHAASNWE